MMQEWTQDCASHYLARILSNESANVKSPICHRCHTNAPVYRCMDCFHPTLLCACCLNAAHSSMPTHRFRQWNGSCFEKVDSHATGYIFHLGHNGDPCNMGDNRRFTLGDVTGLHSVTIRFCRHAGGGDHARQLLNAQIFPCSDKFPASGFSFQLLRLVFLLFAEAKISGQRYYNVMVRQTNNSFPHLVPDRYREFLRVQRQWAHIQDLKRAGSAEVFQNNGPAGDLALRCPACPRRDFNYVESDVTADTRCARLLAPLLCALTPAF
jgi:hypothetical protein